VCPWDSNPAKASAHVIVIFPNEDIAFGQRDGNEKKYEDLLDRLKSGLPEGVEPMVYDIQVQSHNEEESKKKAREEQRYKINRFAQKAIPAYFSAALMLRKMPF